MNQHLFTRAAASFISLACCLLTLTGVGTHAAEPLRMTITEAGALPDGAALNTKVIQGAIDQLAGKGGGTLIIPQGVFLTGALFLKPGVNLQLDKGAVLKGSTNIEDYPRMETRIEGHTQVWRPAILNAKGVNHLRITGEGMIQGGGKPFWDEFWSRRSADHGTRNLDVDRPRNIFIQDSKDVLLSGISLRDSGFWNLHLYRCQNVTIEKLDIRTPRRSPSTDGIDVDSCQYVNIRGCYISVDDDNIALKGTKGPFALEDKDSPPVEHIRISDCDFGLGNGLLTLGSEASVVRDVVVENCRVIGDEGNCLIRLKLRPDTPQHYEDIHYRNITLKNPGKFISIEPWTQYFDLKGQPAPAQLVNNVTVSNVTGSMNTFGAIAGAAKSIIKNITLENIDLQLKDPRVRIKNVENLQWINVKINGYSYPPSTAVDGQK